MLKTNYQYIVGIDPGVNTGLCVYLTEKKHFEIITCKIHEAMMELLRLQSNGYIIAYFEDARKRKWFGNTGREVLQGIGSVKRDCKIWEDFLTDEKIFFVARAPAKGKTKWSKEYFDKVMATLGWKGQSSEHARDATCLI